MMTDLSQQTKERAAQFADLMLSELQQNVKKGEWSAWSPTIAEIDYELRYHFNKLMAAIASGDQAAVTEHAADIGNIAMKAWETFGPR